MTLCSQNGDEELQLNKTIIEFKKHRGHRNSTKRHEQSFAICRLCNVMQTPKHRLMSSLKWNVSDTPFVITPPTPDRTCSESGEISVQSLPAPTSLTGPCGAGQCERHSHPLRLFSAVHWFGADLSISDKVAGGTWPRPAGHFVVLLTLVSSSFRKN